MAEKMQIDDAIDHAIGGLVADVEQSSPRPGADLMARVLADAAAVAPRLQDPVLDLEPAHAERGFFGRLFGWTGSAVATLALGLSVGIAVGMEMDDGFIPMTEPLEENVFYESDGLFSSSEGFL